MIVRHYKYIHILLGINGAFFACSSKMGLQTIYLSKKFGSYCVNLRSYHVNDIVIFFEDIQHFN